MSDGFALTQCTSGKTASLSEKERIAFAIGLQGWDSGATGYVGPNSLTARALCNSDIAIVQYDQGLLANLKATADCTNAGPELLIYVASFEFIGQNDLNWCGDTSDSFAGYEQMFAQPGVLGGRLLGRSSVPDRVLNLANQEVRAAWVRYVKATLRRVETILSGTGLHLAGAYVDNLGDLAWNSTMIGWGSGGTWSSERSNQYAGAMSLMSDLSDALRPHGCAVAVNDFVPTDPGESPATDAFYSAADIINIEGLTHNADGATKADFVPIDDCAGGAATICTRAAWNSRRCQLCSLKEKSQMVGGHKIGTIVLESLALSTYTGSADCSSLAIAYSEFLRARDATSASMSGMVWQPTPISPSPSSGGYNLVSPWLSIDDAVASTIADTVTVSLTEFPSVRETSIRSSSSATLFKANWRSGAAVTVADLIPYGIAVPIGTTTALSLHVITGDSLFACSAEDAWNGNSFIVRWLSPAHQVR
jgi:hypothetical protein